MASRLLIVGSKHVGKEAFCTRLQSLCANDTNIEMDADRKEINGRSLHLRTKYYEAQIEIDIWTLPSPHDLSDTKKIFKEKAYEGIIYIVDSGNVSTFNVVDAFIQDINTEDIQFEVSMLFYHALPTHLHTQTESIDSNGSVFPCDTSKVQAFCIENAIEFIELKPNIQENEAGDKAMPERIGMHRVLEALQCTMWRSMAQFGKESSKPKEVTNRCVDRSPTGMTKSLEAEMDNLQLLMEKVREVREGGKNLSDHERRNQAEAVALQLWDALNLNESDEEF